MSGIRWIPKYIVQAQSPEAKKSIMSFSRRGQIRVCCIPRLQIPAIPPIKYSFLDGGIPSASGPAIKDGGLPSAGGPKIYDGGSP
jgi:hypothetical protein